MALLNKDDVNIWDDHMVEIIIWYVLERRTKHNLLCHQQCWCIYCACVNSYMATVDISNPREILFKNVDNIVVHVYSQDDGKFMTPTYITTNGNVVINDIHKIGYSLIKFYGKSISMETVQTHTIERDDLESQYIVIRFFVMSRGRHFSTCDLFCEPPEVPEDRLVQPIRQKIQDMTTPSDFTYDESKLDEYGDDDVFTQEATYHQLVKNGVPRYFLDYILKHNGVLYWQNV